ncbi:transcriptional repressor [Catenovulum sp. SM1970]|uniref:Fur family transcriptional regulator n=1 Tax=Marinifaba aquimaris TaxID=2741323 RepID=UPI001571961C|nr:Fur family transcriptional regulator [Marinifaba aquimaris]NTS76483.1 transcriptional repressor [Marinifaba aquimaris]
MAEKDLSNIIEKAVAQCQKSGTKLTEKRKNVLVSLVTSETPLSAYELVEKYREDHAEVIAAMSVYRMLDFLEKENLVHKLSSTNKYVGCAHITCCHTHQIPQFLICDKCNKVSEVGIAKEIIGQLKENVESSGFQLHSQQLELHGICDKCLDD